MPVIPIRETAWPLRVYSHFSRIPGLADEVLSRSSHRVPVQPCDDPLTHQPERIRPTDLPSHPLDRWAGLTEDDATRIAAALAATHADSTRQVYAFAWRRWVSWCAGRGIAPFPAEPAAVCAYLTECAERGLSLATIDSACSAIGHQHPGTTIAQSYSATTPRSRWRWVVGGVPNQRWLAHTSTLCSL